jgi:hypothetical protein
MPDEPIEQGTPGAEPPAPAESGPDYSGWFSEAGFDTKQLPDAATIKSANEFYSKYGSESELFTPADLTKKVDEKVTYRVPLLPIRKVSALEPRPSKPSSSSTRVALTHRKAPSPSS